MKNNYIYIIKNLLKREESEQLEFKSDINVESICQVVTAMLNSKGGDVVIGVTDNHKIVGIKHLDYILQLQNNLLNKIFPHAPINFEIIDYEDKKLILINVWEGFEKPYTYMGKIYQRSSIGNRQVSSLGYNEINKMIESRSYYDSRWEIMPILGATNEDLDNDEIDRTINAYNKRRQEKKYTSIEEFLISEGFLVNDYITSGAILLFGNNPTRYIPQSEIRLVRFVGSKVSNKFEDKIYDGNLLSNITSIFNDLDSIFGRIDTVNGIIRNNTWNYPRLALREGVINACAHRDYESPASYLRIDSFNDRTEISSFGTLPNGMKLSSLTIPHQSIRRNPNIAKVLFYRGFMEMLGSGTQRMVEDCRINGFAEPIWKQDDNSVIVTFNGVGNTLKDNSNKNVDVDNINRLIEGITEGNPEGVTEGTKDKLVTVLGAIKSMHRANTPAISERLRIPQKTVERYLKLLRDAGAIEFVGPKRSGHFVIKGKI